MDVGSGSGYLTVLFAMMNPSARVIGVEIIPELVSQSIHNIMKNVLLCHEKYEVLIVYSI